MASVLSAGWRAAVYCLHPRVIALSLLPVLLAGGLAAVLAHFYWNTAVDFARLLIDGLPWLTPLFDMLAPWGGQSVRAALAPLLVLALAVPLVLLSALLLVSAFMGGAIVELVARRRFPTLARRRGGHWTVSIGRSLACTTLALLTLLATLPLWLIPPLALLLPPLIWGWLSMVLMSYDALAEHASAAERRVLMREHRIGLWTIGLVTGYLGAAPSLVWAGGALFLPMMPLLLPVFVWLYTLVFAFASAWFAHYALAALAELRARHEGELLDPVMPRPVRPDQPVALPDGSAPPLPPTAPEPPALPPTSPRAP